MGHYRLDSIAQLARQMRFAPIARRLEQLAKGESLLLQVRPDQAYTIEQVTFAITDFEPKHPDPTLLAGEALQHDLGMLLEEVGETLQLHINAIPEPILTIEDVAQRVSVTSKTVQRWRRRGLPAGRYTFADGKRRIGFRASSFGHFIRNLGQELPLAGPVAEPQRQRDLAWLLEHAAGLAQQGYWQELVGYRLARAAGLSPLALTSLLREHAIQITFAPCPPADVRQQVLDLEAEGLRFSTIARQLGLPVFGVYRIVLERRVTRAIRKPIRFIDDTLYHQDRALQALEAIAQQQPIVASPERPEATRIPRDLPPYLQDLYRIAPLSLAQERGLFLKYQYFRFLAAEHQKTLDLQVATFAQLRKLDGLVRQARVIRSRLVEANLRLVVSVARKHLRPGLGLMELVSEGNLMLIRAVDAFDVHRGFRFSTYAVYGLMKGFARCIPAMLSPQARITDPDQLAKVHDPASDRCQNEAELRDQIQRLMSRLEKREREILCGRYGLTGSRVPQTLQQLGERLKLSRQRVVQIEQQAMAKLRLLAE